jgi:hypothetical protein
MYKKGEIEKEMKELEACTFSPQIKERKPK